MNLRTPLRHDEMTLAVWMIVCLCSFSAMCLQRYLNRIALHLPLDTRTKEMDKHF